MKKFAVTMILALAVSMTACGGRNDNGALQQNPPSVSAGENNSLQSESNSESPAGGNELQNENTSVEENPEQSGNILVAYFSRVGNTEWEEGVDAVASASLNVENGEYAGNAELLAQMAQEAAGGDLFLIQTVETYPSDYRETTNQASVEQKENARPALASHVENMDQYDIVVLVYAGGIIGLN